MAAGTACVACAGACAWSSESEAQTWQSAPALCRAFWWTLAFDPFDPSDAGISFSIGKTHGELWRWKKWHMFAWKWRQRWEDEWRNSMCITWISWISLALLCTRPHLGVPRVTGVGVPETAGAKCTTTGEWNSFRKARHGETWHSEDLKTSEESINKIWTLSGGIHPCRIAMSAMWKCMKA